MLRLGDAAIEVVLTAAECDGKNASRLAGWADEHARRMGPNYCAPSFDDGYVSVDAVKQFIEDWRDAFMIKLHRIAEATEGASRR